MRYCTTLELYSKRRASRREYSVETNSYNCFNLLLPQHEDLHRTLSDGLLTSTDRKDTRNTLKKRRRLFFKKLVPHVLGATHHPSFSNNFAHEILIILPHPPPSLELLWCNKSVFIAVGSVYQYPHNKVQRGFLSRNTEKATSLHCASACRAALESWSWYFF